MPPYSIRVAQIQDIRRNWKLCARDRPLYAPGLWSILPQLWGELLESQRVAMDLIEDAAGRAQLLGGGAFVNARILHEALSKDTPVCATLFRLAAQGRIPFLTRQQLAAENANGSLVHFTFTGTPAIDLTPGPVSERDALLLQACMSSYGMPLAGFRIHSLYAEWSAEKGAQLLGAGGFTCIREQRLPDGGCARLMRFTREDAKQNPGAGVSRFFWTPEPRLRLRRPEQELLGHALQGSSDTEIAGLLGITQDGVKKRWRRVYAATGKAEPNLVPPGAPQTRRKVLLDALRSRPEEIRPYRYPKTTPQEAARPNGEAGKPARTPVRARFPQPGSRSSAAPGPSHP